MNTWHGWLALIGGVLAIVNMWATGYWLDVIGGVLALIAGIGMMMK